MQPRNKSAIIRDFWSRSIHARTAIANWSSTTIRNTNTSGEIKHIQIARLGSPNSNSCIIIMMHKVLPACRVALRVSLRTNAERNSYTSAQTIMTCACLCAMRSLKARKRHATHLYYTSTHAQLADDRAIARATLSVVVLRVLAVFETIILWDVELNWDLRWDPPLLYTLQICWLRQMTISKYWCAVALRINSIRFSAWEARPRMKMIFHFELIRNTWHTRTEQLFAGYSYNIV